MTLFFSRLTLNRSAGNVALKAVLDPDHAAAAMDAHHRLMWVLFGDGPDRRRDFLWRAEGAGRFYVLSAREPVPHDLFEPPEIKPFAPVLAAGDRLEFMLRANATRQRQSIGRVDVVMDALHALPAGERAAVRMDLAQREGTAWLERQGKQAGFQPVAVRVEDYGVRALPGQSGGRRGQRQFGILEFSGELEVKEPALFLEHLAQGFGRARAFGCGLMLIRRAR